MKKFLSLLLALTLVLSLVVVPARAEETDTVQGVTLTGATIEKNGNATLTLDTSHASLIADSTKTLQAGTNEWSTSSSSVATVNNGTVTAVAAGTATITCVAKFTYNDGHAQSQNAQQTVTATVTVTDCTDGVASISFNGVNSTVASGKTANIYTTDNSQNLDGNATGLIPVPKAGYTLNTTEQSKITYSNNKLTVPIKATNGTGTGSTEITITKKVIGEPTNLTVTSPDNKSKYFAGQNITFSVTAPTDAPDNGITYEWTYNVKGDSTKHTITGSGTSVTTTALGASVNTDYLISCVAKINGKATTAVTKDITVKADPYVPTRDSRDNPYTFALSNGTVSSTRSKQLTAPHLENKSDSADKITSGLSVAWDSSNKNVATVSPSGLVSAGNTTGTSTISAVITYNGKTYPAVTYTVSNYVLSADLSRQTYFNNPVSYTATDLLEAANRALSINGNYSIYGSAQTITSTTVDAKGLGQTSGSITSNSNSIYFNPYYNGRGKAPITATVLTSMGQTVTVTLNIPVVPIPTTFDSLTAEPVTTNYTASINNYRITFPSTYSTYYVVQKNGTTAPDYAAANILSNQAYSAGSQYTLSSADFGTNGTCTLYVIAANNYTYGSSYGKYYSGAMTVTQTNYNINYNGVAGETVQFKHTDFTNFMNEVAQARGDSSKTGSYPYVTFSYVTFDYPSTAQGTLYYNGTAMSTSSYSGAFNSRTQITNLDNITFVPYAKTNAKTVAVTFTLHAVKYGTNGTVVNRDVQYRGTVNISLVREDVTFTVAPGDSVTFTDSAFLNYLRAQSGINYNYNIDYVTFDQSAVDTINGGVLYSGYAGFNAVKPTDRFYYTTTNNYTQNALSDVTFRASTYAKTGTTVYIPFTIYARYGTTGVGTRQVTGTVAVKIAQTMNFVDVKPTDYFYNPVKWAVGKNITKGTSAVTFSPDRTCTRAEIVTFLWRDAGSPMPTISRSPFSDVNYSMGADFYNAILWASQNGITAGTDVSHFSPNKTCTRAEIVTFLWRYAKKPVGYGSNSFTDVNKTEHAPYYDAILWAVSKGITNGSTTTTFAPDGTCTRGQAVTFLYRYEGGK